MALTSAADHSVLPLEVTLDGEIVGTLPGSFDVAGEALRVIVPLGFTDIDKIPEERAR